MRKYKVCVYAICKNEGQFAHRWMQSMSEADLVVVLDTGSTDDTVERLREKGARVTVEKIDPWHRSGRGVPTRLAGTAGAGLAAGYGAGILPLHLVL